MQIRHLHNDEKLELLKEFAALPLQPAWVWVAEEGDNGRVLGALIGCRMHGILALLRLVVEPDAPAPTVFRLLRYALRQARQRGCVGMVTILEPKRALEAKLARSLQRAGATFIPTFAVWALAPLSERFVH